MSSSELDHLQKDLSAIRAVTGADLPLDRWDVRSMLVTGCCMLLPAVVGAVGVQSRWLLLASAVPFIAAVMTALIRNYRMAHPSKPCPHEKRKEYRMVVPVMLACLLFIVGFRVWASRAGAPAGVANGCVMIFLGLLLLIGGLTNSGRRSAVLPGIAAIFGGLMWPFCEYLQLWTLLWSCIGVATIGASVIMHRQLVSREP